MRPKTAVSTVMCCPIALLLLTLASPRAVAQERVLETHHATFYGGLSVTAQRSSSGELRAWVARASGGKDLVEAELRFDLLTRAGEFRAFDRAGLEAGTATYDFRNRDRFDTEALLARQTVKSIALAALLLWEDHQPGLDLKLVPNYGNPCPGCVVVPNGCSFWRETCNSRSVRAACERHDACYQCGGVCWGHSRAQCDASFREEVTAATQSPGCGSTFWWGVRLFGWLFMQRPETRASSQPDVYSLGIAVNACPPSMYFLCTTYVL